MCRRPQRGRSGAATARGGAAVQRYGCGAVAGAWWMKGERDWKEREGFGGCGAVQSGCGVGSDCTANEAEG